MTAKSRNQKSSHRYRLIPMRKKDLSSLVQLEKSIFPIDQWTEEMFIDELRKDPLSIKVVKIDDQVIGYVHAEVLDKKLRNGTVSRIGEIGSLAVHEDHRGKKLGETLIKHGIRRLKRKDSTKIVLHTRLDNVAMQQLASTKFGFKTTRIHKNAYEDGASAYEMVLLPIK